MKLLVPASFLTALTLLGAPAQAQILWSSEVAMKAPGQLNGCAIGDFDPASEGNEIVSVAADGTIWLTRAVSEEASPERDEQSDGPGGKAAQKSGGSHIAWRSEAIARGPAELLGCVIGDADPTRLGNEIIVWGMLQGNRALDKPSGLFLLSRGEEGYELEAAYESEVLITGAIVGDFDREREGQELMVTGATKSIELVYLEDDRWQHTKVVDLGDTGQWISPLMEGAVVACNDGTLTAAYLLGKVWRKVLIDETTHPQLHVAAAQGTVVSVRADGTLGWVHPSGRRFEVYKSEKPLSATAVGEFDDENRGVEVAVCGQDRKLIVIYGGQTATWKPLVVFEDTDPLLAVTSGELLADSPGDELVTCGRSGRLVVSSRE